MQYKLNAPYIYLSKTPGQQAYQLFIAVCMDSRFRVVPDLIEVQYLEDLSQINLFIERVNAAAKKENQNQAFIPALFTKCFLLNPPLNKPLFFDFNQAKIEVNVSAVNGDVYSSSLFYQDADEQTLDPAATLDEVAYNCPYVFLTEEEEEFPQGIEAYDALIKLKPYILLAPKGYQFKPENDFSKSDTPVNGCYQSWIILTKTGASTLDGDFGPFLNPNCFAVNSDDYSDQIDLKGDFTVQVILSESTQMGETLEQTKLVQRQKNLIRLFQRGGLSNPVVEKGENDLVPRSSPDEREKKTTKTTKAKTRNMNSRKRHKYAARRLGGRSLQQKPEKKESQDKKPSEAKAKTKNMSSRRPVKKESQPTTRSLSAKAPPKTDSAPKSKTKNMSSRKRVPQAPKTKP